MYFVIVSLFLALQAQAFSDSVYDQLIDTAYYCKVSYCSSVETLNFTVGPLGNACPGLTFCRDQVDTSIAAIFNPNHTNDGQISGYSYLTVDDVEKKLHVAFRGSMTDGDYLTDVLAMQCPYVPILKNHLRYEEFENITDNSELRSAILKKSSGTVTCKDCYVHCGVYIQFMKFIGDLVDTVKPYLDQNYELVVTGHSLGAGYALLTASELRTQGYGPLLITYGSFRVGNPAFNEWVDNIFETKRASDVVSKGGDLPVPSYSRVFQTVDVVPRLPPNIPLILEYGHSGLQFEITKLDLPHPKSSVIFRGPPKGYRNEVDETDGKAVDVDTIAKRGAGFMDAIWYPHLRMFVNFSLPCEDY